ncbi:hypothetical protein KEM52_004985, partial [Ascosphaera acerosa]
QEVLQCWMTCLVERGSLLKYQHLFTSAILDVASSHDPVVFNLPFYRTAQNYRITLQEFTSRRLSLLSSILSNMSMHLKGLQDHHGPELQCASTNYRQLIEGLMQAMKANYQELGTAAQRSQGQYVDFVQSVIGLLQQHVQHICPLDSFFTNPKTFPLPTADPTYLVARILSYELRLDDPKTGKQLVTFIQSVLERVILDGQQDYFASQLRADTAEQSPVTADFQNLRAFASSELATWLETTWAYRDDTCYVRQGPKWVAIAAQSQPRSLDAARSHFLTTIAHFTSLFSHYTTFDTHATHSQT